MITFDAMRKFFKNLFACFVDEFITRKRVFPISET